MGYPSIDALQKVLETDIFHYAKDKRKAAGRGLGTFIEIITYYLLKSWGLNNNISIERGLAEYGNPEISHNVEYSLHPIIRDSFSHIDKSDKTITASRLFDILKKGEYDLERFSRKGNSLLKDGILRNACTIGISDNEMLLCSIKKDSGDDGIDLHIYEQSSKPFAIFECKRVGIEEGMKKGPQTIEKAKQGAYVANAVSSLQKIRSNDGRRLGFIETSKGKQITGSYEELMEQIIFSDNSELLKHFVLTVGIVSNHGNWFTSANPNKEMKVLAQSYDWLLFLTDDGLAEFIQTLVLNPEEKYKPIKDAFISSYSPIDGKKKNQFTKVQMNLVADVLLQDYFNKNLKKIESWFNVIAPDTKQIDTLKTELTELKNKNWGEILK
jgi:hypothetical protein